MRQNFDYVTMDDYASDMREQSELAAGIIDTQRREIRDLKTMFAAAVMAAGGKISIPQGYLIDISRIELTAWKCLDNDTRTFTAKWKDREAME